MRVIAQHPASVIPSTGRRRAFGSIDERAPCTAKRSSARSDRSFLKPPNPFDAGDAFERWLNQSVGAQEITRYLRALYDERADLKVAFPDIDGVDARRFVDWVRTTGAVHERIPERLVPRPSTASVVGGVNLAGYLAAASGVGEAARRMADALRAGRVPTATITYRNTRSRQDAVTASEAGPLHDVNLVCINADQLPTFRSEAQELMSRSSILQRPGRPGDPAGWPSMIHHGAGDLDPGAGRR